MIWFVGEINLKLIYEINLKIECVLSFFDFYGIVFDIIFMVSLFEFVCCRFYYCNNFVLEDGLVKIFGFVVFVII